MALATMGGFSAAMSLQQPAPALTPTVATTPQQGPFSCRDGWVSHAQHRQGACSHHGGIARHGEHPI
ncbi:hypothetical protein B0T45_09275 [Chromobacterium haemolyticum]|uniref:DUF3761 domain-containing protein n=2 Tax=Chromobacterium haemolyticum TaxID=394935 RepID=A0A1W0D1X5_9NEIS|nr:hypothetical protein B0T45_09275 [Chromobacterium haemolyticum]